MTFELFHADDTARGAAFSVIAAQSFPQVYQHVATLTVPADAIEEYGVHAALEQVYHLTQHGEEPWTDRHDITLPEADLAKLAAARGRNGMANSSMVLERRSTSVGDVITVSDGRRFVVAGLGFQEITPDAKVTREGVLDDVYKGLAAAGYTRISAIKALRMLGLTFAEAKGAADRAAL